MADNYKYINGAERLLSRYDGTTGYKPVICLTQTSYSRVMEMLEKVNVCTGGETRSYPSGKSTRTVSFSGEVVDTTEVGGLTPGETIKELNDAADASEASGTPDQWLLGPANGSTFVEEMYFDAFLGDISDDFTAGSTATFSGSLTINGKPTAVNPNE